MHLSLQYIYYFYVLFMQYPGSVGVGNKPHFPDQQSTRQWPSIGGKPSSADQHNIDQSREHDKTKGSGCTQPAPSSPCSNEGSPLQKVLPIALMDLLLVMGVLIQAVNQVPKVLLVALHHQQVKVETLVVLFLVVLEQLVSHKME